MNDTKKERYIDYISNAHHRKQARLIQNAMDRAWHLLVKHPDMEQTKDLAMKYLNESIEFFKKKEAK